jgi:subtilisin-like proprotein convertase family protein
MIRYLINTALSVLLFYPVSAQTNFWRTISEKEITLNPDAQRHIFPTVYQSFVLDKASIETQLANAPSEAEYYQGTPGIVLEFPTPEGSFERYEVWYAPIMAPELCAQYPSIRSYAGRSVRGTGELIRFDVSPNGLNFMCRKPGTNTFFVAPYAMGNDQYHMCYYKKDHIGDEIFHCGVSEEEMAETASEDWEERVVAGDCGNLRTYRLALACTGEYANFHGSNTMNNDKAPALAAMNTTMTRVNGVYETDLSIRMIIIANNTNIIYLDGATDPYTNNNGSTMLGENQTNVDAVIGTANYDIGHVFSTGGGGIATLFSPCNNSTKARGVTGRGAPVGDPFDIDYVAHEIGHQFTGRHTQFNACNRNNATAMEPGSASTIQGYAGICSPNVQSNSDAYFHAVSLSEMAGFASTGGGNSCDIPIPNGNLAPVVAALTNRSIPISTPFLLTGSATDANNDPLLYCWEQMDSYIADQTMPPVSTNTSGPMFRSFTPVSTPNRYFPRLSDLVSGTNYDWEELPSVARTMNFRLTAYDRRANGGCTHQQDMTVTTVAGVGPFVVTVPSATGITYSPGSTQTVTWNVANTTASPVSCANVDILVSTDGGLTYTLLLSNTPNDGSQSVTMPNITTTTARIMVRSVGNIFFDISDNNFSLGVFCDQVFNSTDVPKTIPTTAATITSNLTVVGSANIIDVNVSSLQGTHSYISDLTFRLTSPAGTTRTLFGSVCGSQDNFNIQLDDEAASASLPCPPTNGLSYRPTQTLSGFDGQNAAGTWILTVVDGFSDDGGALTGWGLSFCTAVALPVEWLSFDAKYVRDVVQLDWSTAAEYSNKGFYIERSTQNTADFKRIGWVDGNGSSQTQHDYKTIDKDIEAGAVYYYRLAQEDENGEIAHSDVRVVAIPGKKGNFQLAPNPASQSVQLFMEGVLVSPELATHLRVVHTDGRVVIDQPVPENGILDIQQLNAGIYQIELRNEQQVWVARLVRL